MSKKRQYPLRSKVSLAVCSALIASSGLSFAQDEAFEDALDDQNQESQSTEIEEVVVTGSRLQGTAQAVLEERKQQAFVADILGSEQISRTGDGDAAAALRRVTGLTLVDGKFIYVRGLGERYSSSQLNDMTVPSPDPTRSVMPLDIFPATIIESLSVQKSYSPDLPAHFAGGTVNIRTKSIPNERVLSFSATAGSNTNNSGDSPWYSGGGDDNFGKDDGSRQLSNAFKSAFNDKGVSGLKKEESINLLKSLNRDISGQEESIDPDYSLSGTYGEKFDIGSESRFGFLSAFSYKNEWLSSNERNVNNLARTGNGIKINEFVDGASTEHSVLVSGMLNVGFEISDDHKFEFSNIFLRDTRDRLRDRLLESTNTIDEDDEARRQLDVLYERRELISHQLKGSHNFADYGNFSADWYYGYSEAERDAPNSVDAFFRTFVEDGVTRQFLANDVDTVYGFQQLDDESETYGFNLSLPFYEKDYSLELKFGGDFVAKERRAENVEISIQTFAIPGKFLNGGDFSEILSDENLAADDFTVRLDDRTTGGDKYAAATRIDAFYLMADAEVGSNWRFTGGVRFEDFKQVSIPFQAHSPYFDVESEALRNLVFKDDQLYPSLAATYIMNSEMQFRFNYSQTTIRPDLRDISTSFYIDPLTEFLVRGSTSLQSSDINNIDFRWEWYLDTGENLSVALFAKDIDTPIEQIELPKATEGAPQLLTANAKTGELYGIEFEFLKDFTFLGNDFANYFVTGNFTLSDSEVDLGLDGNPNTESLFEQQLAEALNTDQSVTEVITNNKRRLIGHSEWVANVQFGWDSLDGEHALSVVYNAFGPRIIIPGVNGFEDGQEETFHSFDMVYTYYPTFDTTLKLKVKNLFDAEKEIVQEGVSILREDVGTSVSLQVKTNF